MFQEFIRLNQCFKFFFAVKKVIFPINFILSRWAGRGCDDKMERQFPIFHPLDNGILPNAGRTGNDDQQGGFFRFLYFNIYICHIYYSTPYILWNLNKF